MKTNRAYKFRIYPNHAQRELIERTIGCARFVYNVMLAAKIDHYKKHGKNLPITPAMLKPQYPFLREVDSLALCNAQPHLDAAYRNFFRDPRRAGFPRFKAKHRARACYTTNNVRNTVRFENGGTRLRLPKIGLVRARQHLDIPAGWKLKSVTVERTRSGKYSASVLFEGETQTIEQHQPESFTGLDYSSHDFFVSDTGMRGGYPRYYRQYETKLSKAQRALSRMEKGSNNWRKQKIKVARIHEKITDSRKDFLHKTANRIISTADCVCVEDLDMRSMSQSLKLGKSTMDNGWGMFRAMLEYKLEEQGKRMVKVDRFYPSSQLCSTCGYKNGDTKDLSVREWTCPECGTRHDRDINAATNIRNEGKRILLTH